MNIKSFAIGSVVGAAVGMYGLGKILDSLTEHKYFIWGFRNFKESTDDKLVFNMQDFKGSFKFEYNKRKNDEE